MKTRAIILLTGLLLAGCGGGGDIEVACDKAYWDGTIGTCLPVEWQVIERSALDQRGAPPEVLVAFQAVKPTAGQFPTVTVTRETVAPNVTTEAYSEASIRSVQTLPNYEEIGQEAATIDEIPVNIHIFSAQPKADEPVTRFFQVSFVGNGAGYTFTGAVPLTVPESLESQITLILRNATVNEPATEE